MKLNTKKLAVVTVFAALYAVGVVFFAPISFGIVQVRVADAMLPLAMIFGFLQLFLTLNFHKCFLIQIDLLESNRAFVKIF